MQEEETRPPVVVDAGLRRRKALPSSSPSAMLELLREPAALLGEGTMGSTYSLRRGRPVLKRIKQGVRWDVDRAEFEQRVTTAIATVQDGEHVVPLRGHHYSEEEHEALLLYDGFRRGSLWERLHGRHGYCYHRPLPDWEMRLSIALTAARGVASIHRAGRSSCHGNIKSSNILLAGDYRALVSGHGLSALVTGRPSSPSSRPSPAMTIYSPRLPCA